MSFLHSSVGKESICNAGDPSSIPGSRRSTGEGISYPLQYSRASLVTQLVKNPPAMQEIWVLSLGWEDSPGEGKGYPLQYPGLENSMDCIVHGMAKSQTRLSDLHFPLGLTSLISLLSKGFSRVFSSTTVGKHQFFGTQPSLSSNSHVTTGKTIALQNQLFLSILSYLMSKYI